MTDYLKINLTLASLIAGEKNFLANASNFVALLWQELESINWVGFYFFDGSELVLSVFQGKPACIRIPYGKGVCGTAYAQNKILIIEDVHKFSGHIACDSASNSEIVLPLVSNGITYGVLDIDSPVFNRFSQSDVDGLAGLLNILLEHSDIQNLSKYYESANP